MDNKLTEAFTTIVNHLKNGTKNKALLENFEGTPDRCVRALLEMNKTEAHITEELTKLLKVGFPVNRHEDIGGMVTQGPIRVHSICPHHLMVAEYSVYVAYLPSEGRVLGLSKLARLVKLLGKRPVLQEQLAADIADVLYKNEDSDFTFPSFKSRGSAVLLVGSHGCMSCRGVHENALTSVTELRGTFWEPGMEQKFLDSVHAIKTSNIL